MHVTPGPEERRRVWKMSGNRDYLAEHPEPPDVPPCNSFSTSGYGAGAFFCDTCWWTQEDHRSKRAKKLDRYDILLIKIVTTLIISALIAFLVAKTLLGDW